MADTGTMKIGNIDVRKIADTDVTCQKIAQTCVRIILIADSVTQVSRMRKAAGSGVIKDSEHWCQKMTTAGN